jgi:SAM-dependent methyltransferase
MTISENIAAAHPNIQWSCTDIHPLPPQLGDSLKWKKYRPFDGRNLPFETASFDVVMLSDVLHHCMPQAEALLREANRVGKYVIVKDHYECGFFSRQMLRLMDFVGNYGYGVGIPSRYFTPETFAGIYKQAGLHAKTHQRGIDLYADFPLLKFLLNKDWQFVAVLEK